MQDDRTNFSDYLTPQNVIEELLRHRLHEVEKSAAKQMRNPGRLMTIASRLAPPPGTSSAT